MNRLTSPLLVAAVTLMSGARNAAVAQRQARSAVVADARRSAIVDAAGRAGPAVVSVNVLKRERQVPLDPFAQFFMPRGFERQVEGYGSGFVISSDGIVITNQHVTDGAEQIVVTTREGADYPAKVLGEDPLTDIAVLKIDATGLPTAPLGSSADLLVGVNSSIFTPSGGSIGIGFAIPIERAVRVASELRRYGHVRRPWAGLDVAGSENLRDWKRSCGLRVTSVADGGPAARAGLAADDILLTVRGRRLRTFLDWEAALLDASPGDTLPVAYRRSGRTSATRLGVTELPSSNAEKVAVLGDVQVVTVTAAIRQERGIGVEHGALIYN